MIGTIKSRRSNLKNWHVSEVRLPGLGLDFFSSTTFGPSDLGHVIVVEVFGRRHKHLSRVQQGEDVQTLEVQKIPKKNRELHQDWEFTNFGTSPWNFRLFFVLLSWQSLNHQKLGTTIHLIVGGVSNFWIFEFKLLTFLIHLEFKYPERQVSYFFRQLKTPKTSNYCLKNRENLATSRYVKLHDFQGVTRSSHRGSKLSGLKLEPVGRIFHGNHPEAFFTDIPGPYTFRN